MIERGDQIQAAIDALPLGGEIILGEGILWIESTIRLRSRITLRGQGRATVLRAIDGLNANMIELADKTVDLTVLRDLRVDGNKDGQSSGHGIFLDNDDGHPHTLTDAHHLLTNVVVHHCKGNGIHITGDARETMLEQCKVYTCDGCGFYNYASDMKYVNCIAGGNGTYGLAVEGWNAQLTNCKAFWNGMKGFRVHAQCCLTNCQSEENYQAGFEIVLQDNLFVGCVAHNNGRAEARAEGFWVGGDRTQLMGCYGYDSKDPAWQSYGYVLADGVTNVRLNGVAYGNNDGALLDNGAINLTDELVSW